MSGSEERERRLPLEGTTNFRDLGGYATAGGRRVRWGRLYRSDRLPALTVADHRRLEALDLSLVCDLRSDEERERKPNRLHPESPPAVANIPVEVRAGNDMDGLLAGGERHLPTLRDVVLNGYREFVHVHQRAWSALAREILEAPTGAAVFHCSAGQDRTGFGAALLLLALEVPRERVVEDYMLTAVYRPGEASVADINEYVVAAGGEPLPTEFLVQIWKPGPDLLEASFREMEASFGGVDGYLDGIGLDPRARAELRARLLED